MATDELIKLSRELTLELIRQRITNGIYSRDGNLGRKWSWGVWRGRDIGTCPDSYLYWHLINNDDLNLYHLEYLANHFSVSDWDWPLWTPPNDPGQSRLGHASDSKGTEYYDGTSQPSLPISEDLYWFRLGKKPSGTGIIK